MIIQIIYGLVNHFQRRNIRKYYRKLFWFSFYFSRYTKHLLGKIQIDKSWLREFKSTENAKASHSK